jgi:hypothetical protein
MDDNTRGWWVIGAAAAVVAVLGVVVVRSRTSTPPPAVTTVTAPAPLPPPAASTVADHHPIEEVEIAPPKAPALPALDQSDDSLSSALIGLLGQPLFESLLERKDIVRRIVATVDNLPRESVAQRMWPMKAAGGRFLVSGKDDTLAIAPENSLRYAAYLQLVQATDPHKLVAIYVQNYPLFQQAYQQLGYPQGYFNDRLIVVIDQLLKTPAPPDPKRLAQPHVLYQYADPQLESLSFGQKVLLRMGNDDAAAIKAKLGEIRRLLVREGPAKAR